MSLKQLLIETGTLFGATYATTQDINYSIGATAFGAGILSLFDILRNNEHKQLQKKLNKTLDIKKLEKIPVKRTYVKPLIAGSIVGVLIGTASYFAPKAMPHIKVFYPTEEMYQKSLETTKKGSKNAPSNAILFGIISAGMFIRKNEKYNISNPLHETNRQNEVEVIKKLHELSKSKYSKTIEQTLYIANNRNYKQTKESNSKVYLTNQTSEEKDIILKENIDQAKEELKKILNQNSEEEAYHNFVKSTYLPFNEVKEKLIKKAYYSKYTTKEAREMIRKYNNKRKLIQL